MSFAKCGQCESACKFVIQLWNIVLYLCNRFDLAMTVDVNKNRSSDKNCNSRQMRKNYTALHSKQSLVISH